MLVKNRPKHNLCAGLVYVHTAECHKQHLAQDKTSNMNIKSVSMCLLASFRGFSCPSRTIQQFISLFKGF